MKQLRWVMEGGFWDVDISTPITLNGVAQPVVEAGAAVPLGLSRGTRLSRPKQIDFMQRFMAAPFVPSYSGTGHGLSLQHVLTLPMGNDWFTTLLGQFNAQKLVSAVRKDKSSQASKSSWLEIIGRHIRDKSFYAFGFCSEFLLTPEDTILVAYEAHGDSETSRKKAVFHHKASMYDRVGCLTFLLRVRHSQEIQNLVSVLFPSYVSSLIYCPPTSYEEVKHSV